MKQRKDTQNMLNALKKGDRIATVGGLLGTVVNVGPAIVEIKINEETKAKVKRSSISEILADDVKEAEIVKEPALMK